MLVYAQDKTGVESGLSTSFCDGAWEKRLTKTRANNKAKVIVLQPREPSLIRVVKPYF